MLGPFGDTVVVVAKPLLEIGCHTDVEATFSILDDIDPRHGHLPEVVAGFEPAIRQLPDYEPDGTLRPFIAREWFTMPPGPLILKWLRGRDLNPRPSGYEPDELPGCSTPRF